MTPARPRISVCMGTYNGSLYLREQLDSILCQLDEDDEVVIVDDASSDSTCSIIESRSDPRIKLIRHSRNAGVVSTFENAIRSATGEIIFLSDQDDVWNSGKVERVLKEFALDEKLVLVVSNAMLIGDPETEGKLFYGEEKKFSAGVLSNLISCRYLGCTLAFKSSLARLALPLPKDGFFLHDQWLGTVNALFGGRTKFIDEPLVLYRRHQLNVTGLKRLSRGRQVRLRFRLLLELVQKRFAHARLA